MQKGVAPPRSTFTPTVGLWSRMGPGGRVLGLSPLEMHQSCTPEQLDHIANF
eukprot:SAG22_NODE_17853_length_297_cov_1.232323_2_plen_51_part_01